MRFDGAARGAVSIIECIHHRVGRPGKFESGEIWRMQGGMQVFLFVSSSCLQHGGEASWAGSETVNN